MIISFRTYLLVGIIIGGIMYGISLFAGEDVIDWVERQQRRADSTDVHALGVIIGEPLILWVNPELRPFGAIAAGLFWPAVIFWPLMVLLMLLILEGLGAASDVERLGQAGFFS
jgi:hypothetical protein